MMPRFTPRRVAFLILTVLILGALLLVLSWCSRGDALKTERAQGTLADARTGSAVEAIEAIGENTAANAVERERVEDAQEAIRQETDPVKRDRRARCELRHLHGGPPC